MIIGPIIYTLLIIVVSQLLVPVSGIIGGEPVDLFFVLVLNPDDSCGGMILETRFVLTAASCLYRQDKQRWAFTSEISVLHDEFSVSNDGNTTCYSCDDYRTHKD